MVETVNLEKIRQRVQADAEIFRHARSFPHMAFADLLIDGLKEKILVVCSVSFRIISRAGPLCTLVAGSGRTSLGLICKKTFATVH
jgi:hypothetical protein